MGGYTHTICLCGFVCFGLCVVSRVAVGVGPRSSFPCGLVRVKTTGIPYARSHLSALVRLVRTQIAIPRRVGPDGQMYAFARQDSRVLSRTVLQLGTTGRSRQLSLRSSDGRDALRDSASREHIAMQADLRRVVAIVRVVIGDASSV